MQNESTFGSVLWLSVQLKKKKKKKWDCGRCCVEAEPYFTYVAPGIVVKVHWLFTFEPKRSNHCLRFTTPLHT